jgi:membrane protein YdbS with pleckstrin-like domain
VTEGIDQPVEAQTPPVHDLPPVADSIEHRFHPKSITARRLVGGVWVVALALIFLVVVLILVFAAGPPTLVAIGLIGAWLIFAGTTGSWVWFGPAIRFKHASYRVSEQGVQVRDGILWRSVVNVPRSRVQHTDVSQGPVERKFGLATLIIHTAGNQQASVPVSGLPFEVANQIRDLLIDGGQDDAV